MKRVPFIILLIALCAPTASVAKEGAEPLLVPLQGLTREPELSVGPALGLACDPMIWGSSGAMEGTRIDEQTEEEIAESDGVVLQWLREALGADRLGMLGGTPFYVPGANDRTADLRRLALELARQIEVDIEVRAPSGATTSGQIQVAPGGRANLRRTRTCHLLAEYGVEIACDNSGGEHPSALGNPGIMCLTDGVVADVRAYDLEPGGRIAIEAIVQVASIESRTEQTRAKYLGSVDFPTSRGGLAVLSAVVRPGMPVENVLRFRGDAYRIRLTARRIGPAPAAGPKGTLRRYDVGLHTLPAWEPALDTNVQGAARVLRPLVGFAPPLAPAGLISRLIQGRAPQSHFVVDPHGVLFVDAPEDDQRVIEDALHALTGCMATGVELELTLRADKETVAHCTLSAIDGHACLARVGIDHAAFLGADVEVG